MNVPHGVIGVSKTHRRHRRRPDCNHPRISDLLHPSRVYHLRTHIVFVRDPAEHTKAQDFFEFWSVLAFHHLQNSYLPSGRDELSRMSEGTSE